MTEPITETAKPAMKWYVVHTYSGYEHKAKAALEERVRSLHKEEKIGKVLLEVGEAIKVVDGPFQDFNGTVEEVKPEKGKVRVLISIFGRATPVELDFVQVEKA